MWIYNNSNSALIVLVKLHNDLLYVLGCVIEETTSDKFFLSGEENLQRGVFALLLQLRWHVKCRFFQKQTDHSKKSYLESWFVHSSIHHWVHVNDKINWNSWQQLDAQPIWSFNLVKPTNTHSPQMIALTFACLSNWHCAVKRENASTKRLWG